VQPSDILGRARDNPIAAFIEPRAKAGRGWFADYIVRLHKIPAAT
jgi:hypothetical protein